MNSGVSNVATKDPAQLFAAKGGNRMLTHSVQNRTQVFAADYRDTTVSDRAVQCPFPQPANEGTVEEYE